MTVETILKRIADSGLKVDVAYQAIGTTRWAAALRPADDGKPFGFAEGHTLAEALEGALANATPDGPGLFD